MIDLTKAKEAAMFSQTFVADPEHDHFIGPEVPRGEAWALTTLWMRAGQGGLTEAMCGVVSEDKFIALMSRHNLMDGDALSWSGNVILTEGEAPLYLAKGARQDAEVACSATWTVLNVTGRPKAKTTGGRNGGSSKPAAKPDQAA